jgi:hypothetical protein
MMILYAVVAIVAVALIVNAANRSGKIQLPSPGQGTDADAVRPRRRTASNHRAFLSRRQKNLGMSVRWRALHPPGRVPNGRR